MATKKKTIQMWYEKKTSHEKIIKSKTDEQFHSESSVCKIIKALRQTQ